MTRYIIALTVSVLLSACSQEPTEKAINLTVAPPVYCEVYQPIRWSKADTPETVRSVLRENAKFTKTCPASKPKTSTKLAKGATTS